MQKLAHQKLFFDQFTFDLTRGCLLRGGEEIKLRPKSFETLKYLVENSGRLVSKDELVGAVWPGTAVTDNSLVQCLKEVREALGDDGQRLITTVPRRGYIFEAEVSESRSESPPAVYAEQIEGVHVVIEEDVAETYAKATNEKTLGPASQAFWKWGPNQRVLTLCLLAGLVGALYYFWLSSKGAQPATKPQVRSIAVLPFKPLAADASDEYLGLGMADTLITKLASIRQIIVRPTSAVQRYTSPGQDSLSAGREQKVDAVLEGSIQRSGDKVRVTVRLLNVHDGSTLWAYKYDEHFADIFAVQDTISEKVADALALNLSSEERQRLAKRYTDNTEAYQLYVKGVFLRNQMTGEALKRSLECFQKAIELDPKYALAYTGQASSYSPLAYLGHISAREAEAKNKPLVMKALELDYSLAEAHAALAEFKLFIEWDWEGAERAFKRALELNPSEQLTLLLYPDLLLIKGRSEEAVAMSKLALDIDPLSPRTGKALAWVYFFAGQYDQAIEQSNKTRELFPDYVLINLGPSYEQKGMHEQAINEYLDAEARWGMPAEETTALRKTYASSGWRGYWDKRLELAKAEGKRKPVQAVFIAGLYSRLGDTNQALDWLERAYEERDMSLILLNVDPSWKPLRSEPRFRDLLRRMRLEPRNDT
jgi:TolB-like protein/DNA-binding winged helix-turn-helix (wHTH) protein